MAYILSTPEKTLNYFNQIASEHFRPGGDGVLACILVPQGHEDHMRKSLNETRTLRNKSAFDALLALKSDGMKSVADMLAAMDCAMNEEERQKALADELWFEMNFVILDFMGQQFAVSVERYAAKTRLPVMASDEGRKSTVRFVETASGRTAVAIYDTLNCRVPVLLWPSDADVAPILDLAKERAGSGFDIGRGCTIKGGVDPSQLLDNALFREALDVYPCGYAIRVCAGNNEYNVSL